MCFRIVVSLVLLFEISVALSEVYKIPDVDFMESMTDGNRIAKEVVKMTPRNIKIFQEYYEAKKPSKMPYSHVPYIPKIMHQIWDGPMPPLYQSYFNECKKLHPDWEFKFWSDKDIDDLGLEYRDVFDKARSYAGRADIARYEILYRFGGVYRDMDVKCFHSIDELNHKYTFFAPIEPPFEPVYYDYKMIPVNNGIIGASPHNSILKAALNIIRNNFDKQLLEFENNPEEWVHSFAVRSTLFPLTEAFVKNTSIKDKNIVFPTTYFFSLANRMFDVPNLFGKKKYYAEKINKKINDPLTPAWLSIKPESLMFHNTRHNKREILYTDFKSGNNRWSPKIKNNLKRLDLQQQKVYGLFKRLYEERVVPDGRLPLNNKSKTPQVIHFVVFDEAELSVLNKHLHLWEILNRDFEILVWNKERVSETFKDIDFETLNLSNDLRFYLGLRILEKCGGTYADFKAKPIQPIFELNNQFSFYAGLKPLVKSEQRLSFSRKLIGAKKAHLIVSNALKQIDLKDIYSLNKIDDILIHSAYLGVYFDGKNVVLPAVYFQTFANTEDESWSGKMKMWWDNKPKAFSTYTPFSIVE